ncbi:MAG: tRNA(adenine34) deaminase [Kiritimatiellia bacterium]|jgi:tRNA(adenine34) deaminase
MNDQELLDRAVQLALQHEASGGLPIASVVALQGEILSEGVSDVLGPPYHPGRHAEVNALAGVPVHLWPRAADMTVVTTLEPCVMCFGTCLLHGVGRIVFGALDVRGGARFILDHLPDYYADGQGVPEWVGPLDPGRCDALYRRADRAFAGLPCGIDHGELP